MRHTRDRVLFVESGLFMLARVHNYLNTSVIIIIFVLTRDIILILTRFIVIDLVHLLYNVSFFVLTLRDRIHL